MSDEAGDWAVRVPLRTIGRGCSDCTHIRTMKIFCTGGTFARYAERGAEILKSSPRPAVRQGRSAMRGSRRDARSGRCGSENCVWRARSTRCALGADVCAIATALWRRVGPRDPLFGRADESDPRLPARVPSSRSVPMAAMAIPTTNSAISAATTEAWQRAGDPTQFPEQLGEDRTTHSPRMRSPTRTFSMTPETAAGPHGPPAGRSGTAIPVDVGFVKALLHIAEVRAIRTRSPTISRPVGSRPAPSSSSRARRRRRSTLILSGQAEKGGAGVRRRLDRDPGPPGTGSVLRRDGNRGGQAEQRTRDRSHRPHLSRVLAGRNWLPTWERGQEPTSPGRYRSWRSVRKSRGGDHAYRHRHRHRSQDRGDRGLSESIRVPTELISTSPLLDLFGVEYFVRPRPLKALETEIT